MASTLGSPVSYSDAELIAACCREEEWAWQALVDRYRRLVYSIPLQAGLSSEDAADVFQTVFVRLWECLTTIREPNALPAWLITVTKRETWRAIERRRLEVPDDEELVNPETRPDLAQDSRSFEEEFSNLSLLMEALGRLNEPCRTLIWLLFFDRNQPSYEDIAQMLQMPVGSIGPTRARCLARLKHIVERISAGGK